MRTLIKHVTLLTLDQKERVITDAYLIIKDEKIAAFGVWEEGLTDTEFDEVVDGKNGILLPGMVNTHTHVGMIPFRSLGDDTPDRLRRLLFPLEAYMTPELTAASARYAIAEMLLSGITTFADMYYFEEEIAAVCEEMKVRALVGETIIEMPTCNSKNASESLAYCESMLLKWRDHPLITPIIAPHAPNTNSEATLRKVVALSQKYHAPIMMHVAEMTYELDYFEENYRQTPIAFLSELGFLKRPFIMAHCILANEQDLALLADSDARVAHCIAANTKSAKGVAPIKELLAEKIPVGLGTDGPSSGNTLELFTQMRLFADFHKTKNQDRSLFPAKEIVRLATCGGAEVLGLQEQIGSIVVGKKADLVLVETEAVNMFPIYDPYAALVYSANAGNVSSVWVNGRCLVKEKQLLSAKISVLRQQLAEQMGTFRQKAAELTDGTISV